MDLGNLAKRQDENGQGKNESLRSSSSFVCACAHNAEIGFCMGAVGTEKNCDSPISTPTLDGKWIQGGDGRRKHPWHCDMFEWKEETWQSGPDREGAARGSMQ